MLRACIRRKPQRSRSNSHSPFLPIIIMACASVRGIAYHPNRTLTWNSIPLITNDEWVNGSQNTTYISDARALLVTPVLGRRKDDIDGIHVISSSPFFKRNSKLLLIIMLLRIFRLERLDLYYALSFAYR